MNMRPWSITLWCTYAFPNVGRVGVRTGGSGQSCVGGYTVTEGGEPVSVTGPSGGIGETICAPGEATFKVDVITGPGGTLAFPTSAPV